MKLVINGEERSFTAPLTLAALVGQLGMKSDRVAVELNRDIVPRESWPQTSLSDGDQLEIVQFVGGGSAGPALAASGPVTRKVTYSRIPRSITLATEK
jgi:thiamine biosynthesis protein ThiS